MRMWTDERAASTSARIRGKKLAPSTRGSMVAAVDQAKSKRGVVRPRPVARRKRLRRRLRSRGRHRLGRRRPARALRDEQRLSVHEHEHGGTDECRDRESLPRATRPQPAIGVAGAPHRGRHGGPGENDARGHDEHQPVGGGRAEYLPVVEPVLDGRPGDRPRRRRDTPAIPIQDLRPERPRPAEREAGDDHREPAVVGALRPVEGHGPVRRPGQEDTDYHRRDRDPSEVRCERLPGHCTCVKRRGRITADTIRP